MITLKIFSRHLASTIKAFTLFATHFQELVSLEDEISSVANVHVTAMTDQYELTMLYKVCPGSSDRSFGLEIAKMAGFQKHVIEVLKKIIIIINLLNKLIIY